MNHKATAVCSKGHKVEFGSCQAQRNKLFGGIKVCGSKGYVQPSQNEVQCVNCRLIYSSKRCPTCGVDIPVSHFKKESLFSKLG